MKNYLLIGFVAVCLCIGGCAKKQTVAPEEIEAQETSADAEIITPEQFAQEPSIRSSDADSRSALATIYFDLDSSNISGIEIDTLKANISYLVSNPNANIVIEGHCDERGTTEYNLALGQKRAVKVKEYYVQLGIAPNRIATVSYGEEMPADKRSNEAAWAKNRRAETKIIVNR